MVTDGQAMPEKVPTPAGAGSVPQLLPESVVAAMKPASPSKTTPVVMQVVDEGQAMLGPDNEPGARSVTLGPCGAEVEGGQHVLATRCVHGRGATGGRRPAGNAVDSPGARRQRSGMSRPSPPPLYPG